VSALDNLLRHLDGVKRTGDGRYIARCPAHDDRHPSLSLREADDGKVLAICRAGCAVDQIVNAIGLDLTALFPPRQGTPGEGAPRQKQPFSATDLLLIAGYEAHVAGVVLADVGAGKAIPEADRLRAREAASRLIHIAEVAHGRR
jgi:hypothetical protein